MSRFTRDTPAYYLSPRELKRNSTPEQREQRFRSWLQSIPWTFAEMAAAMRTLSEEQSNDYLRERYQATAQWIEKGRMSKVVLAMILPVLIKTCTLCGKKAWYRTGNEGRCRDHKMVPCETAKQRAARLEARSADIETNHKEFDQQDAAERRHHKTDPRKRRKQKP